MGGHTRVASMKRFFILLLAVLVLSQSSFALTAADPAYWSMNRSLSGVTQKALESRGYVASDPRTYATLQGMSNVAGGSAAAVTGALLAGATAPGWVGIAIVAGISTAVGYAVSLGLNSLGKWLFRSDNLIDESGDSVGVISSSAMNAGGQYWKVSFVSANVNIQISGGDGEAIARQGYSEYRSQSGQSTTTAPTCSIGTSAVTCSPIQATLQPSGAPASCMAGTFYKNGACAAYSFANPSAAPSKSAASLQTAIADIPAADKSKPLNPVIVAATANQLWRQAAAKPGYSGFPYPQANPITAAEAQTWQQTNPAVWPSVSDFVSPKAPIATDPTGFALPSDATAPTVTPTTQTDPSVVNPGAANPLANLGPDPATPQPTLEKTPTAHEILSPLLNLMPDMRSFQVPTHSSQCPIPEFDVWGNHFKMNAHCNMIQDNHATIEATFVLVWAILALFIVLST